MRAIALGFALGAAWLQTRAGLPEFRWLWLLPPLALAAAWLPARWRWPRAMVLLVLAAGIGFFYAAWRAESRLADQLAPAWQGRDIVLQGRVIGLPELTPRGQRFIFQVETASAPRGQVPARIMLSHYRFDEAAPLIAVQGGDCLRLTARLARPHGNVNPGGFDYEAWLLERGIRATGHLVGEPLAMTGCAGAARAGLDRTREVLRGRLQTALMDHAYAGIAIALAVGDQNAIPDAQWTLFRHTGVTHLMSISGLHVTLFAALTYWLTQLLWRRLPGLSLRLPAQKAGAAFGLVAAAAYVALAGFGIPAQRTLYMLAAAALVRWLDVAMAVSTVLALALFAVVAIDPWAALSPGFWLSFGAVAALLLAAQGRLGQMAAWRTWLAAQWAVGLALLPALLLIFHEVSLISPLANAFAIPLISWLAVPLVLLASVLPVDWLAQLAHGVIAAVMQGLVWLDALPQPVWHGAAPNGWALLLALLGAVLLILPRGLPGRWLGLVLMLPLLFPRLERPGEGELWLDVLDVGQGLAIVARTAGHVLLFDAGPHYASGEDAGSRVVAPYLYAQGINRVDGLIVSHDDSDHSGGAVSLAASHRPGWALASFAGLPAEWVSPLGQDVLRQVSQARPCIAGQHWTWDGVHFELLHPTANHYRNGHYRDNDRGCVLKVATRHGAVLIPADIERLGEMSLLERVPERLQAEVLIAPHHGSGTSSMPAFLAAVQPRWVVIPVGHRNRFGHPKPEVVRRYLDLNATVLRTDRDGAVSLRLDGQGIQPVSAREADRRYWFDR
ncbi:competence protein ComEC [Sulfuritortus calidifontis]|uniref:Competence protein ComEC n=1 Tax=Sulfuritortus calidifontis TaxID=1914471 RepID=A0A4R3JZW4_9PROT|nr:DNA internalization-related competence protein ComEC/Rec2 [Sulfuritortus calidifontis]TCS73042.1 competence protein ComEC [Sulfuritortus calidifontis]